MDPFEITISADGKERNFIVERIDEPHVYYIVRSGDGNEDFEPRKFYADKENCSLRFPVEDSLDHDIATAITSWCLINKVSLIESIGK